MSFCRLNTSQHFPTPPQNFTVNFFDQRTLLLSSPNTFVWLQTDTNTFRGRCFLFFWTEFLKPKTGMLENVTGHWNAWIEQPSLCYSHNSGPFRSRLSGTFIFDAIPVVVKLCQKIYAVYKRLPIIHVQLIIGTVLCFFGGMYPTVFAALQVGITFCFFRVGTPYCTI